MRYVPYTQQIRDADTDEFKGIAGTAFSVRESDEGGLSTTWVEYYGLKTPPTLAKAASAYRDSLKSKKLAAKAYFAIGNVEATRACASNHNKSIRLVHAPDGTNVGHVEIHRFSDDDRRLLDALAIDIYREHEPVMGMALLPSSTPPSFT